MAAQVVFLFIWLFKELRWTDGQIDWRGQWNKFNELGEMHRDLKESWSDCYISYNL